MCDKVAQSYVHGVYRGKLNENVASVRKGEENKQRKGKKVKNKCQAERKRIKKI